MPIKTHNPTTPSRRFATTLDFSEITKMTPEKALLRPLRKQGGRNHHGEITSRHRGGGHKRMYRVIDFKRNKDGVPATVEAIEYDPNRTCNIALLKYRDGERRYILAPLGLKPGMSVNSGPECEPKVGNSMPLKSIPVGLEIHNVELVAGGGGTIVRAAGTLAQLSAKEGDHAIIILPSGEIRKIRLECRATIGQVGNVDHFNVTIGKAGRNRWKGFRPYVRGVAQNPVSHPMGGGEGRSGGGRHPCGPTGVLSKGGKTRKRNKQSNRFIVRKRKSGVR